MKTNEGLLPYKVDQIRSHLRNHNLSRAFLGIGEIGGKRMIDLKTKKMENYFAFYGISVSFHPDEEEVRRIFYANSKRYHPDFYTLESEEKQAEVLELSSKNNKAFELLSNPDAIIKYVLQLKDILDKDKTDALPPMFLMEMMDVNESIEKLEADFDVKKLNQIKSEMEEMENNLYDQVKLIIEDYSETTSPSSDLEKVKDFYLKKQYLLRIKKKLATFASRI